MIVLAFMIAYVIVPYRRVRLRSAFLGAIVAGLMFQVLRWGFAVYIAAFPSYRTLYGTLSVIPIFLLWVYLVWCVVLFGGEVVAAFPEWRRRPGAGTARGSQPARRLIAALLMLERLFAARSAGNSVGTDALADVAAEALADSDRGAVQAILDRLQADKVIGRAAGSGWYLVRDPKSVKLSALLRGLDLGLDAGEDLAFIRTAWRARLAGVLAGAGAAERDALEINLDALFAPVAGAAPGNAAAGPAASLKRKAAG
jgi:membrane protein